MKKILLGIGGAILSIIIFIALAFAFELGGLKWDRYFKPKHENVRREVFKETRSYNEAKAQELLKYRYEFMTAKDDVTKQAIADLIRHTFAEYDETKLSPELCSFLRQIKYSYKNK